MKIEEVLSGMAVKDTEAAARWYERLFGRPADARPMDGLVEWHHGPAGTVQLIRDAERAGGSLLTLATSDASETLAALAQREVDVGPLDDTTSDKVLFATVSDPDGNAITIVQRR